MRALKQRSYTAPRDFYDIYHLTKNFSFKDWGKLVPVFLKKMEHKSLSYQSPNDLVEESKLKKVKRAWKRSVEHQIERNNQPDADVIIEEVASNIKKYLPDGKAL